MSIKNKKSEKLVKSINKNVRSSTRKLNPILRSIVGKKVDVAVRNLSFSDSPASALVMTIYLGCSELFSNFVGKEVATFLRYTLAFPLSIISLKMGDVD